MENQDSNISAFEEPIEIPVKPTSVAEHLNEPNIKFTENSKNTKQAIIISFAVIFILLILDQWLKVYIKTSYQLGEEHLMIGNWARLHFIENNGIAFGIALPGNFGKIILTIFRILASAGIYYLLLKIIKKGAPKGLVIAGSLVFAGAIGNILDCVFYGMVFQDINSYTGGFLNGRVVDMLYFPVINTIWPNWVPMVGGSEFSFFEPIFNLADASISTGIIAVLLFYKKWLKHL